MKILFASPEVYPFAKTGGLGDVASGLPKALRSLGNEVAVIMPLYGSVNRDSLADTGRAILLEMGGKTYRASILEGKLDEGLPVYLLDQPDLYGRPQPYGDANGDYPDNDARFIFYCRAVLETAKAVGFRPDIIHSNDWQGGLVPVFLSMEKKDGFFDSTGSVFTIHNLAYQGHFPPESFSLTGLPKTLFSASGVEMYGKLAMLKSGILFADAITTVSPTYAREIMGKQLGFGLEKLLRKRRHDLYGVLNGIDGLEWNPLTDPYIPENYGVNSLAGKKECRKRLLEEFGLQNAPGRPVVGIVSRLVEQKGFDIVEAAKDELMKLDFALVALGAGQREYEEMLLGLAGKYPDRVGVKTGYDNRLSHLIEAGSDIFLMPSRFEPCGLNQMYSLVYGTVPVVRATGGLNDTVEDFDPKTGAGNGFVFRKPTPEALFRSLKKAVITFREDRYWSLLVRRGMKSDFSWGRSASEYLKIYGNIRPRRR